MSRTERMSERFGIGLPLLLLDEVDEASEEVRRLVRAGRRLGVVLHGEERQALVLEPFDGAVVQVRVREDRRAAERVGVDGEAVVLRRDLDLAGLQVLDGLVRAVVAELELVGATAER